MGSEQFNARVPEPHNERVHRYADARGLSKSEASRRLIQHGLAKQSVARKVAHYLGWLSLASFTFAAWLWGVAGGMAAPLANAGTAGVATALLLTAFYLVLATVAELAARGYFWGSLPRGLR